MAKPQQQQQRNFNLELTGTARDLGELQYNILLCVTEKHYEEGVKILLEYQKKRANSKPYVRRTGPIFHHAEELIRAIETKKNFPNIGTMTQTKQEEVHQKVLENWEDLKICLRRLRAIEKEMATEDARSSIWVVKALLFSFMVSMFVFVVSEGFRSFGGSFISFMHDTFDLGSNALSGLF
jgi:hypothetical protein